VTPSSPPARRRGSSEVSAATTALRARATYEDAALAARTPAVFWFPRTVVDVIRKGDRDRLLGLAGEAAFFAVLTLFPALLVVAAVLGQLGTFVGRDAADEVEEAVLTFLDRLLTDTARPAVDFVAMLFSGSGNVLTFATLLALASLSTAFSTLVNTVNLAYDVPETRGWWYRRALGLVLGIGSVITGAVAVTLLVIGPIFGRGIDVVAGVGLDDTYAVFWDVAQWPLAFVALVLWATTLQHLSPADRHRWRHDLPGGLLTAVLWLAASAGLNVYLSYVVPASPVLGALGGGLIVMIWFYLLCVALLGGAELNAVLAARRRYRAVQRALAAEAAEQQDLDDEGGHDDDGERRREDRDDGSRARSRRGGAGVRGGGGGAPTRHDAPTRQVAAPAISDDSETPARSADRQGTPRTSSLRSDLA
jgi:membrane protein